MTRRVCAASKAALLGLWVVAFAFAEVQLCTQFTGCSNATSVCNNLFDSSGTGVVVSSECISTATTNISLLTCQCSPNNASPQYGNATARVNVTIDTSDGICVWDGTFERGGDGRLPDQASCTSTTGLCPTRADHCGGTAVGLSIFAAQCASRVFACSTPTNDGNATAYGLNASLLLQCFTCDGGTYRVYVDEAANACAKQYTPPASGTTCVPTTTCNGHGCCAPTLSNNDMPLGVCSCFYDSDRGFWSSASQCSQCDPNYDSAGDRPCTRAKSTIVILLQSLGETSPAVMILPNLFIVVFFVIFGTVRRVWPSDGDFKATTQRRAGLPWVYGASSRNSDGAFELEYVALPLLAPPTSGCAARARSQRRRKDQLSSEGDDRQSRRGADGGVPSAGAPSGTGDGRGVDDAAVAAGSDGRHAPVRGASGRGDVMLFHAKTIPKRPRGSTGIVSRWEAMKAQRGGPRV